ncbi:HD domain-containing protein [archaeon]|jgi:GTP diphosphokinase / guanosine-3',5'-bis(diphosphate) 3'-diphosphatase|nr:HD domain-containing protein [archaeon]MBT3578157.1 HD domain-containing protein [archaeon]MBT6820705.1 HD domain-containing protein [archaeon]MBT6956705.1 HD domain-containing protein [archaeon]MBT7024886.1 HD domain-containing protein [archaeon]
MEDYLKKIFQERKDLSEEDKILIEKAYSFAEEAHKGQMKGKKPFFIHPATVGLRLAEWGQDSKIISAGLLHDTVEDTKVKLSEIKKEFGEKIAFYVDGMSWSKKKVNGKMIEDYEGLFKKFLEHVKQDPTIAIIKAGDMFRAEPKDVEKFVNILKEKGLWEGFQKMINWRFRGFWLPFFREIGFNKLVEQVERGRTRFVEEKNVKVKLYDYIPKEDLEEIKTKINGIKGLEALR